MALDGDAIRVAVRELLEGDIGAIRTCSGLGFRASAVGTREAASQVLVTRTHTMAFVVDVGSPTDHEQGVSEMSNVALRRVEIAITTWHRLKHHRHKAVTRDDALGDITTNLEKVREAMCWPGNLTQTDAGDPTGIIVGAIDHISGSPVRIYAEQNVAESVQRYSATVLVSTPIS